MCQYISVFVIMISLLLWSISQINYIQLSILKSSQLYYKLSIYLSEISLVYSLIITKYVIYFYFILNHELQ